MSTILANTASAQTQQLSGNNLQSANQLNETYDDFLRLLTTQLQYQDPLNPADSTEFTNQLVQFSQVEQQISMNQKLDSLLALGGSQGVTAALGYIGLEATYEGTGIAFDGQTPAKIDFDLPRAAKQAELLIRDDAGTILYRGPAPSESGVHSITWDGKTTGGRDVDPGAYRVEIAAVDTEDNPISVTTQLTAKIVGVETQADGSIALSLGQGLSIPDSAVLAARQPDAATPNS